VATTNLKDLSAVAAIVTGASLGIGLAIARRPAIDGAAVAINFHSHPQPALALADETRWSGGRAIARGSNVTDESGSQH
jgi:glucose 1-dehydrogenase